MIARLNEWRIAQGGSSLKPNTTLRDLAYAQGKYLLTLVRLPDDLHIDAQGRNTRQRAVSDEFKWPHYASPKRVAIGENIYIKTTSHPLLALYDARDKLTPAVHPPLNQVRLNRL